MAAKQMTDAVTRHQNSVAKARLATLAKFGADKWPVKLGTPQHKFWLEQFDEAMRNTI